MDYKKIAEFCERWEKLFDKNHSFHQVVKDEPNKDIWFKKNIMEYKDVNKAEELMSAIEKVDIKAKRDYEINITLETEQRLRKSRNEYLTLTDRTQLPDFPLSQDERKLYREYRQFLRDLPVSIRRKEYILKRVVNFEEWKKMNERV